MVLQTANPNPIGSVFLMLLIVLSCMAVIGGKGAKWKIINLLIIFGFMAAGLAIGFALGAWGGSPEVGGHAATTLMILLGCVGAFASIRRNKRREKVAAQSMPRT